MIFLILNSEFLRYNLPSCDGRESYESNGFITNDYWSFTIRLGLNIYNYTKFLERV